MTTPQYSAALADPRPAPAAGWIALLALVAVVAHTAFNGNYGFHRDELATLADARHLDFGFVAYPPMTPAIGRVELLLFGTALAGFRFFAAVAFGVSMLLAGSIARDFGGGRAAQILAAVTVGFAPLALIGSSLFQYVAFDYLAWVALSACVVRMLNSGDARWWLAIGAVIGLGLQTKYTIGVWVVALGIGLLATHARALFLNRWFWIGAAIGVVLILPNLLWQWRHDFISLDFLRHIHERDVRIGRSDGFILDQFLIPANPLTAPLWLAGLYFLLLDKTARRWRALGIAFVAAFVLMLALRARGYYLAPAYPLLIAAGAVLWQRGVAHLGGALARAAFVLTFVLVVGAGIALGSVFVPAAPLHSRVWELSATVHDDFREQIGWPNFARTIAAVFADLPADTRASTAVLAANYGEAGALDLYRDRYVLPPVISAVNSYWLAGYGEPPPRQLIVTGYSAERLAQLFGDCRLVAHVENVDGVDNEESRDHPDVYLCREPRAPWPQLWQQMRHYG